MWEGREKGRLWHSRPGNLVKPECPERWARGSSSHGQVCFKSAAVGQAFTEGPLESTVLQRDMQKRQLLHGAEASTNLLSQGSEY